MLYLSRGRTIFVSVWPVEQATFVIGFVRYGLCFALFSRSLSFYPYAPLNLLLVNPHLAAWLPELTLRVPRRRQPRRDSFLSNRRGHDRLSGALEVIGRLHIVRQASAS